MAAVLRTERGVQRGGVLLQGQDLTGSLTEHLKHGVAKSEDCIHFLPVFLEGLVYIIGT